ncbi:hypothetical protein HGM15179_019627 [Zosterops borbonicus]|uniref:Uncharacterized protein n=1 Tax=Zosterops borbonicus TaxID=364589 RepID=A0A8K1DA95_9PASS|nr:hypothetical protein HGM15179_019627 [Zosterops borbonicus]
MVMIDRIFIQEEKTALALDRQLARDRPGADTGDTGTRGHGNGAGNTGNGDTGTLGTRERGREWGNGDTGTLGTREHWGREWGWGSSGMGIIGNLLARDRPGGDTGNTGNTGNGAGILGMGTREWG